MKIIYARPRPISSGIVTLALILLLIAPLSGIAQENRNQERVLKTSADHLFHETFEELKSLLSPEEKKRVSSLNLQIVVVSPREIGCQFPGDLASTQPYGSISKVIIVCRPSFEATINFIESARLVEIIGLIENNREPKLAALLFEALLTQLNQGFQSGNSGITNANCPLLSLAYVLQMGYGKERCKDVDTKVASGFWNEAYRQYLEILSNFSKRDYDKPSPIDADKFIHRLFPKTVEDFFPRTLVESDFARMLLAHEIGHLLGTADEVVRSFNIKDVDLDKRASLDRSKKRLLEEIVADTFAFNLLKRGGLAHSSYAFLGFMNYFEIIEAVSRTQLLGEHGSDRLSAGRELQQCLIFGDPELLSRTREFVESMGTAPPDMNWSEVEKEWRRGIVQMKCS